MVIKRGDTTMILKRIFVYLITFLVITLIVSVFSVIRHWDIIAAYFANSVSSLAGLALYLLIIVFGIGLIVKSLFR